MLSKIKKNTLTFTLVRNRFNGVVSVNTYFLKSCAKVKTSASCPGHVRTGHKHSGLFWQ